MNVNAYVLPNARVDIPINIPAVRFFLESAVFHLPYSEYEPAIIDDDPITPEEEENLSRSWADLRRGNVTVVPMSYTDEDFLRMLGS
jgi:hypothetical protein